MPDALDQLRAGEFLGATRFAYAGSLREFPRALFDLEESLEVLDLSSNELRSLPDDFGRFRNLKIAFFSNNQFEELPKVLGDCPSLGIIGFRSNRLQHIHEDALPLSLHWLTLTNNCIESIPDSIGECRGLRKVGLAGNKIKHLPDAMQNCVSLELLRISANYLEKLPDWLLRLPMLRWLGYSGNPCTFQKKQLPDIDLFPWKEIELQQLLGQGASGNISRALLNARDEVAVKMFKGEVTSDGFPKDEMDACIVAGSHPHLVPLKGRVADHPGGKQGLVLGLIPERYEVLGHPPSLASCTRDQFPQKRRLSREVADEIYEGVKSAVGHLHAQGIMHGDIYAHNTFFDASGHAILGDFGAATFFDPEGLYAELHKTIDRRALEVLREDLSSIVVPEGVCR